MKVTLLKSVLVGSCDVMPTAKGQTVELDDSTAREFCDLGLAREAQGQAQEPGSEKAMAPEGEEKMAPPPENKMAPEPANKTRKE